MLNGWLFDNENLEITEVAFILNISNNFTPVQQYILLETKYYIFFSAKHLEKPLSFINIKNKLKRIVQTLEIIASDNNEMDSFIHSWDSYKAKFLYIYFFVDQISLSEVKQYPIINKNYKNLFKTR